MIARHTRLLRFQAAQRDRSATPDAILDARHREDLRRAAVVPRDPAEWTDEQVGLAIRLARGDATRVEIAAALDRPVDEVARRLAGIRRTLARWQERRPKGQEPRKTWNRRVITDAQLERAIRLRRHERLSWEAVAKTVGCSSSGLRYLLNETERGQEAMAMAGLSL